MLITVDAGNSNVKFAIFDINGEMLSRVSIPTNKKNPKFTELKFFLNKNTEFTGCAVSSVVPEINEILADEIMHYAGIKTVFINNMTANWLHYDYKKPEMLGADRIANVLAAQKIAQTPALVCDFGTATTFSCILRDNEFSGGLIAPGVNTSLAALTQKASRLPAVDISERQGVIGKSTYDCIASGVFHMQKGFVQGVISEIKKEYKNLSTICTGGFAPIFQNNFDFYEENLVLLGCKEFFSRYVEFQLK